MILNFVQESCINALTYKFLILIIKVQVIYTGGETMNKNIKLIRTRNKAGLTQQELADRMQVTKSTVSNWENGYSNPNLEKAIRLSDILNCDVKELI